MCYSPITIKDPKNKRHGIQVPCGRCLECKKKIQNDWAIRMTEELKGANYKGVFFTLTYNEDTVPINLFQDGKIERSVEGYHYKKIRPYATDKLITVWNDLDKEGKKEFNADHDGCPPYGDEAVVMYSVRKKDVQDWIKRCRKMLDKQDKHFTYFLTSEYGPTTQRPHYHGLFIGVTKEDVAECFNDWREKFGFVTIDDIDPAKGGIRYCAKYASKGVYEHPFCSKDFFYWNHDKSPVMDDLLDDEGKVRLKITEYHSKHYERSMQYFGIDEPICDPTFHLVSKGMGIDFIKNESEQRYHQFGKFELQFEERAVPVDNDGNILKDDEIRDVRNTWQERIGFGECKAGHFSYGADPFESTGEAHECDFSREGIPFKMILCKKDEEIQDFCQCGDIYIQIALKDEFERMINNNKYRFKNYGSTSKAQTQTYGYSMPRYYYQKMYGEGLRTSLAQVVLQDNVDLYQEQFEQLRAADPTREDTEILLGMEYAEEQKRRERAQSALRLAQKQYGKSKL